MMMSMLELPIINCWTLISHRKVKMKLSHVRQLAELQSHRLRELMDREGKYT